jgi:hypothetical protein
MFCYFDEVLRLSNEEDKIYIEYKIGFHEGCYKKSC